MNILFIFVVSDLYPTFRQFGLWIINNKIKVFQLHFRLDFIGVDKKGKIIIFNYSCST